MTNKTEIFVQFLDNKLYGVTMEPVNPETVSSSIREVRYRQADLAAPVDAWKTIDSAPRDGTNFLGYCPSIGVQVMRYNDYGSFGDAVYDEWDADPTHWMHLPKPPAISEAMKGK